jgi:hypothetical protein
MLAATDLLASSCRSAKRKPSDKVTSMPASTLKIGTAATADQQPMAAMTKATMSAMPRLLNGLVWSQAAKATRPPAVEAPLSDIAVQAKTGG